MSLDCKLDRPTGLFGGLTPLRLVKATPDSGTRFAGQFKVVGSMGSCALKGSGETLRSILYWLPGS